MCLIYFSTEAFLIYNLAFLNLEPYYKCYDSNSNCFACKTSDTCKPEFSRDLTNERVDFTNGFIEDN